MYLKKLEYRFLVKNTKFDNASYNAYKTAKSEFNVKTNRI